MFEQISKETNVEKLNNEVIFLRKLETLPDELAKKWENEYGDLEDPEDPDFFMRFNSFLEKRKQALMKSLEIEPGIDDEILEEIVTVQEVIQNTFGNTNYFLNNGSTAEVYELPIAPHLYVKYINNQEKYNDHNHLRVEYDFLRELDNFEVQGIRTPSPYFIQIHPSEGHLYGMERVLGKSLSQILEKPTDNLGLIKLVKKMDRDNVKARLIEYIKKYILTSR